MRIFDKRLALIVGFLLMFHASHGAIIYLNSDSNGTGANTNIYNTVWDSGNLTVTSWGTVRDYQFRLQSPSSLSLTDFYLQVSASLRNQTPIDGTGVVGAAWFNGTIAANPSPSYSSAIATSTLDTALLPIDRTAFDTLIMGPGSFTPDPSINSTPTEFFIRIWATGDNSNKGVQLKLVDNALITYNPAGSSTTMDAFNGTGYVPAGTFVPVGGVIAAVPEPSQIASSIVLMIGFSALLVRNRRRITKSLQS